MVMRAPGSPHSDAGGARVPFAEIVSTREPVSGGGDS
jgi:hypothetical protein